MKKTGHRPTDLAYLHYYFSQEVSYLKAGNIYKCKDTESSSYENSLLRALHHFIFQ